jgi:transcription elongation factor GreA
MASRSWENPGMSNERIPMSKEGYEKKKAELDRMTNEEMPNIAEQIAQARGYGDLSENAEFDAAVEAQGMLQAKINDLQDKLARALIVDKLTTAPEHVMFGCKVKVLDTSVNDEEVFVLVGPGDEDYENNKILTSSPIGQGLLGKKKGDVVEIAVPRGVERFEILEISFP